MATHSVGPGQRGAGSWLRFLAAIVILGVVAVGIPIGLVVVCRAGLGSSQPLPSIGSWDEIRSWVTTQRSSTEIARVALRILISLCWMLWAGLLLSVLSSVLASRPGLGRVRLPRIAIFDGFGAWIVTGLTALTSLAPNVAHAQPTGLPVPAVIATTALTPTAAALAPETLTASRAGWGTVQAAESIEMFAARTLGAADRWHEVWELNQGRTMDDGATFSQPWKLHAGWQLELPAPAAPPAAADAAIPASTSPVASERFRPAEEIVVAYDDNLWNLCLVRLRFVAAPDGDVVVSRLLHEVVSLNPSIDDPNLIYTGQRIVMPAVGTPPVDSEQPPAATYPASAPPAIVQDERTHTIVYGDTLWDILKATYGYVDVPLVHHVADYNQLADPNNIPIGTVIRLPALPGPAVTTSPPPVEVAATTVDTPLAANTAVTVDATIVPATPVVDESVASIVVTDPSPAASSPPLRLVPAPSITASTPEPQSSTPLPWALGGVASVGLATGLLELWRRRRRARWAAGGSPWRVGAASEQPPEALAETSDLITVEWVASALSHLADETRLTAVVVSVEYDQSVLAVRWDRARPIAPSPWWSSDDGWVWNLASSARLSPPDDGPIAGFPGLVTFGERDGRQYLVNLAAPGTVAVDGPGAEAFVGALVLELGTGQLLSDAVVHLHGVQLASCEQIERVLTDFDDPVDTSSPTLHLSVIESDEPALDGLAAAVDGDSRRAVLILGSSDRTVGTEVRVETDGTATQNPGNITFRASLVPGAILPLDVDNAAPTAPCASGAAPTSNVVRLDRHARRSITPPRMVLRLFSSLLPDLEPRQPGVDARAMTIIAALDYLGTGRPPQQLAELLRIKVKTIQNKLGRLRELRLVHSDGSIWTLDAGVCSDAEWMLDLAHSARDAISRDIASRALSECWELLTRVTGPAYAAGGGSSLWGWVDERDEDFGGATAVEQATSTLFDAVGLAVETWDMLAATGMDDLFSADRLVDMLMRVEATLRVIEPWPLFEAAALAAGRTGLASTRQKLATRLAQLVHDSDLDPPDELVAQVIG
jgi:LysM domain